MRWRACIELSTLGMCLFSKVNKFDISLELNIKFENSDILYIDFYKSFLFTVIRKQTPLFEQWINKATMQGPTEI